MKVSCRQTGPGTVGIIVKALSLSTPGSQQSTGVLFIISFLQRSLSESSRLLYPTSERERGMLTEQTLHVTQVFIHVKAFPKQLLLILCLIGCRKTVAQRHEMVTQYLPAHIHHIKRITVAGHFTSGCEHGFPYAEQRFIVIANPRISCPVSVSCERRTGIGEHALSQLGGSDVYLVQQPSPRLAAVFVGAAHTAVGPSVHPLFVCQ